MEKIFEHKITAKFPDRQGYFTYVFEGRNIPDAKNKFKTSFPNAKIIACVRGREVKSLYTKPEAKTGEEVISGTIGTALLGLVAVAGIAIYNKFTSNNDK